ncbi:CCA tRNA nucleotidyltransferase [Candidatus Woesearchaeota archaeon]|nr:CCA tRNA nucleotidyltransferase [Candidatus Woesearchaeota archaeon]
MRILEQIKPSRQEIKRTSELIDSVLEKIKVPDAKLELGGSYAKDTFLSGNYDIDVFVRFPYLKYKDADISQILINSIKQRKKVVHGSRDYVQIEKGKYIFEFIPVLDIKKASSAKNITDVSPLHKDWVKRHVKNKDDVRLLKKFCRAGNIYGAESYIKGFSGYVLEILTYRYGNFFNLVKNASQWKIPVFIDPINHYSSHKSALSSLNGSKKTSFILIDPTDKTRNAAAAISGEKLDEFIALCKNYLHNPSDEFFIERGISIRDLKVKSGFNKLLILKVKPRSGKKDVVGNKILKVYDYLKKQMIKEGFKLIDSGWEFGKKSLIYYVVEDSPLEEHRIHYGPPSNRKNHFEEFRRKWKDHKIYWKDNKCYVMIKRGSITPKRFLKRAIHSSYVKSNVKKIRLL